MRGKSELSGKQRRHNLILGLIRERNVETQEDIVAYLRQQDIDVTQATVSRDIKELRLVKVMSQKGVYKYATVDTAQRGMEDRFARIFSESALGIERANNLLVIRTVNGAANAALLCLEMLAIYDDGLADKLEKYRHAEKQNVLAKNAEIEKRFV